MHHTIHTRVNTQPTARACTHVPYTQYTHTYTCSRPLGTLLRNQNASLWCAPSRSTVQLFSSSAFFLDPEPCPGMWSWRGYDPSAPRMESRNSAACFLIPGTGQAFLPSAKGLCFCETKPERAVSWSELNPRPPQILLLGCLSQSLMVLGNPLPFPVLAASSGGTQGKGSL